MKAFKLIFCACLFTATLSAQVNYSFSGVPAIYINLDDEFPLDEVTKTEKILGTMRMENANGSDYLPENLYDGLIKFKGRGNTTWYRAEKKSWSIDLIDALGKKNNRPLLGMPSDEDWVLLALEFDKSLLKNYFMFYLCNSLGQWAPHAWFVELYVNGEYQGVYMLCENIKKGKNRVDIQNTGNEGEALTGGYIIESDYPSRVHVGDEGSQYITSSRTYPDRWYVDSPEVDSLYFGFTYPKPEDLTPQQKEYMKQYISDFETALFSADFQDPDIGFRKYADENSFIDWYVITELSADWDQSYFLSSVFLTKPQNGKLKLGPRWDFDLAFQSSINEFRSREYTPWMKQLWNDTAFCRKVKARIIELKPRIDAALNAVDIAAEEINRYGAVDRNYEKWQTLGKANWSESARKQANSYTGEVRRLKQWIQERYAFLTYYLQDADKQCDALSILKPVITFPSQDDYDRRGLPLSVQVGFKSDADIRYVWNDGSESSSRSYSINQYGKYSVTVTNGTCTSLPSDTVEYKVPTLTVLRYKELSETTPADTNFRRVERFIADMQQIRKHYNILSLQDCEAIAQGSKTLEGNSVIVFFDNSTAQTQALAQPTLDSIGITATFQNGAIPSVIAQLPVVTMYSFTPSEYIDAYIDSKAVITQFNPVADRSETYVSGGQKLTIPITGIKSNAVSGNANVAVGVFAECNNELIDSVYAVYSASDASASVYAVTNVNRQGKAKINVQMIEPESHYSSGYFYLTVGNPDDVAPPAVEVITYNGFTDSISPSINNRNIADFKRDLEYFKQNNIKILALSDLPRIKSREIEITEPSVVLTFDDGGKNDFLLAAPLLQQYGYPATFFVVPEWMGKRDYMTWDDVEALSDMRDSNDNKLFTIGSHSYSHRYPGYKNMSLPDIADDLARSKAAIESHTGVTCEFFAYPYGRRAGEKEVEELIQAAGYTVAQSSSPGLYSRSSDIYNVGTLFMYSYTVQSQFDSYFDAPDVLPPAFDPIANVTTETGSAEIEITDISSDYYDDNSHIRFELVAEASKFELMRLSYTAPAAEGLLTLSLKADVDSAVVTLRADEGLGVYSASTFLVARPSINPPEPPTGIDDVETVHAPSLQAYPNPTDGECRVKCAECRAGDAIEVFSVTGRRVTTFTATGEETTIDLSDLPDGLYLVKHKDKIVKVVVLR